MNADQHDAFVAWENATSRYNACRAEMAESRTQLREATAALRTAIRSDPDNWGAAPEITHEEMTR